MMRGGAFRLVLLAAAAGGTGEAATIVVPPTPAAEERQAAADLAEVWRRGTGEDAQIRGENDDANGETGPWFFLGEAAPVNAETELPVGVSAEAFRVMTLGGERVVVRGASPIGTELGAEWYAQHGLGARWFWPGDLGEVVPSLKGWRPEPIDRVVAPAFVSRQLESDRAWLRHNGLNARLPHMHNLLNVFPRELFNTHPEWFPVLEGKRYKPKAGDYSWQPNLALPDVADHAAQVVAEYFKLNPRSWGFSLSENDSDRFDQSERTTAVRGPMRWFRGRPDYSNVVFAFMNRVADEVAKVFPNKLLSAYAYDWCENTPMFQVRANVVPWLTADRSQYYDPAFEKEDHALIERWCRSGAKVVGIYEYLEGNPFLVPRQTTQMLSESIKFEYDAGARAYSAEGEPNLGLDGPKLWVAAELLWDPSQSLPELLDDYYRSFWGEAAGPMRSFDQLCEKAWTGQKGPSWWLKFYDDEAQVDLFPPEMRKRLRGLIEEARARAVKPEVKARVELVSTAFAVTEKFAEFCEARGRLSDAGLDEGPEQSRSKARHSTADLLNDYLQKKTMVAPALEIAVKAGVMSPVELHVFLRNDPAPRIEAQAEAGGAGWRVVTLQDRAWDSLAEPALLDDRTFWWSQLAWKAVGAPAQGRRIRVLRHDGVASVRLDHAKGDSLFQWVNALPGRLYRAEVDFRGKVSSGNETFIIINWLDINGQYSGTDATDQLPPGDWSVGRHLLIEGRAPANALWVGLGLHVYNQVGDDFAEFSHPKLSVR